MEPTESTSPLDIGGSSIGGMSASALADRFGTPLYAFDRSTVVQRADELATCMPHRPVCLFYSVKAHASLGLLRLLRRLGVGADTCSPGDLAFATAAGFSGDEISYTSVSLTNSDSEAVVAGGAFLIADSPAQLEVYARAGGRPDVGLRVLPSIAAGPEPLTQAGRPDAKFGVPAAAVGEVVAEAGRRGMRVTCLHGHLGSDIEGPGPHLRLLELLLDLAVEAAPLVSTVDLGGGWATPFLAPDVSPAYPPLPPPNTYAISEFGAAAEALLSSFERATGRTIELRLEPGAYLLMDAGYLIARVTDVKGTSWPFGRARRLVILDTSYNHLHSAVAHGTMHRLWADVAPSRPLMPHDVAGDLMQAGDLLAVDRLLPRLDVDDVVVFGQAGAYKASRAPVFNNRPRPAEVLVADGDAVLLRRRELPEDLLQFEAPPG